MGTRYYENYYDTEEEAKQAVSYESRQLMAMPGYSEIYVEGGPTKVTMTSGKEKWQVRFKEYYG